jgi:hypothetical protein
MLLRQVDRKISLSAAAAAVVHDPRHPDLIMRSLRDLIAQRLYALACGYEHLNDPAQLRTDPLLQTAVGRSEELGNGPTLSRPETHVRRKTVNYSG